MTQRRRLRVVLGDAANSARKNTSVTVDGEVLPGVFDVQVRTQAGGMTEVTLKLYGYDCEIVQYEDEAV